MPHFQQLHVLRRFVNRPPRPHYPPLDARTSPLNPRRGPSRWPRFDVTSRGFSTTTCRFPPGGMSLRGTFFRRSEPGIVASGSSSPALGLSGFARGWRNRRPENLNSHVSRVDRLLTGALNKRTAPESSGGGLLILGGLSGRGGETRTRDLTLPKRTR